MFAIQLLRDWVDRGLLVEGENGFALRQNHDVSVPDDVHRVSIDRLLRFAGDRVPRWLALERTAALGREVDADEWRAVCSALDLPRPAALRDALVKRGLAERTDDGWRFSHGLLVDSIGRHAREHGRWRDHHRHCVALLSELYPDSPRQTAGRRADHWIAAGELQRALDPLFEQAERQRDIGHLDRQLEVLERREALMVRLGIPEEDERFIHNDIRQLACGFQLGRDPAEVVGPLRLARQRAERTGNSRLVSDAHQLAAVVEQARGEMSVGRSHADEAIRRARQGNDEAVLIRALNRSAGLEQYCGAFDAAERRYTESLRRVDATDHTSEQWTAAWGLAWIELNRGDFDSADRHFQQLLEEARETGLPHREMKAIKCLGEVARHEGDARRAREYYRRFAELGRELNQPFSVAIALENRAMTELMAGQFDAAGQLRHKAQRMFVETGRLEQAAESMRLCRLVESAGLQNWSTFDEIIARYADGWPRGGNLERDPPWLAEMAGDYAAEADEPERATRAWRLALTLWEAHGDRKSAADVARKLAD